MKVSKLLKSKFRQAAVVMPPLKHWPDREVEFKWENSEVVRWLLAQQKIQEHIFEKARSAKMIKFDSDTGVWVGVEYSQP